MNTKHSVNLLNGRGIIAGSIFAFAISTSALAIPPTDPDDPPPLPPGSQLLRVEGALTFRGCSPAPSNVSVQIAHPPKSGHPTTSSKLPDGSIRMSYRIVVGSIDDEDLPEQVTVIPHVSASVCGSSNFSPASRTVRPNTKGVNFDYQARTTGTHIIPVDSFLFFANGFLSRIGLHLNNDGHQDSFITIDGVTSTFNIPVTKKDLPGWGTGSGIFKVRDMNLDDTEMTLDGNAFNVRLGFEEVGREIKGYHSLLGDGGMPDFQMSNINLNVSASLFVGNAQLRIGFSNARLDAGITSTSGCHPGFDLCNFLFGTNGDIKKNFQKAALAQLQGSTIQEALRASLADALAGFGITQPIGTVTLQGNQIVITTI
jgi:hypothetical protein